MLFDLFRIPCGKAYEHVARFAASGDGPLFTFVKIVMLVTVYPFIYLCIYLDRKWCVHQSAAPKGRKQRLNPLIPFPRRPIEVREHPTWLFERLVSQSPGVFRSAIVASGIQGPTKIVFSDAVTYSPLDTEPDKNKAVIRIVYKFFVLPAKEKVAVENKAKEHALDVFLKTPSVREFSVSLKALAATFSILPREVVWYRKLMLAHEGQNEPFPLPVPGAIFTEYARLFDTYIVATHTAGGANGKASVYRAIPDWRMNDLRKARHMLAVIATFHAANWDLRQPAKVGPSRSSFDFHKYFPAEMRNATAFVSAGMSVFFEKRATASFKQLWPAIARRLQGEPLVMSHGDFRPGNMLWNTATPDVLDIVVCDMELATVTSYGWDASYMMYIGLPVGLRREHEAALFTEYLTALHAALRTRTSGAKQQVGGTAWPAAPGSAAATTLHQLFGLALFFYGWTLAVLGEMPSAEDKSLQGNTNEDAKAWHDRMLAMLGDLVGPLAAAGRRAGLAAELGVPERVLEEFFEDGTKMLNASKETV